ncbi:hypothetical protein OUZ56_006096 [Daphnia magna]|uniref:Uncharacterized protein n=1 Tax=Daphnia magna TaxID=35525 RepID=A0ABQ9YUP7_9CRUS|nr:hypothetical protein OUZ56_006096 [Daphnia magna]
MGRLGKSQTVQSPSILIGISFSKIGSVESGYSCILHSGALDFHNQGKISMWWPDWKTKRKTTKSFSWAENCSIQLSMKNEDMYMKK